MAGLDTAAAARPAMTVRASAGEPIDNPFAHMSSAWSPPPRRRWPVKTESNVRRENRKKPDPPCPVCSGLGKVKCHRCNGRGRTNLTHLAMLPKGEWPKWCWDCHGCGMSYCSRCLGSGERRGIIGFHLPDNEPRVDESTKTRSQN